jgi:hypothetical protein
MFFSVLRTIRYESPLFRFPARKNDERNKRTLHVDRPGYVLERLTRLKMIAPECTVHTNKVQIGSRYTNRKYTQVGRVALLTRYEYECKVPLEKRTCSLL